MSRVLRRAAAVAGVIGAVALPAAARADVCDSSVAAVGRCDTRRPSPSMSVSPPAPHAGSPVVLNASSPGRGVSYAWDLDGDGAFDDAVGADVSRTFPAGTATVAVRATDADGRTGSEVRTLPVHASNLRPSGRFAVLTPSPGPARVTDVVVDASDADGQVVRVDLDLEGDGVYEQQFAFAPGEAAHVEHGLRDPIVGTHTLHARIVDDAGAMTTLTTTLQVHGNDLPPRVAVDVSPSQVRPGEPVVVSATAIDPDGPEVGLAFDLDGDGTYETEANEATSVVTTFASAGTHEVGVQARDDEGLKAVSRASVQVDALVGAPFAISVPAGPVRPGVAATYRAPGAVAWDMDADGAFDDAVGETPSYAFGAAGTFTVRARTAAGRVAMRTVTVVADAGIAPAVTALDLPPVIRAGVPTRFGASGTDPEGDPVTLTFDLDGDGVFDDVPAVAGGDYAWTFPASSPITIAVRATDPTGRSGVRTAEVAPTTIELPPAAGLAIGPLVAGQPTPLGADVPAGATVAWDTDGDGAFGDPATFTPPAPGEYTLRARVEAEGGGETTVARTVTAGTRSPVAAFSSSDDAPQTGQPVTLTAAATDPDGDAPLTLLWDLDDDGAFDDGTGKTVSTAFAAGDHVIGLEARDPGGDA
ncbi:MAG TPA: PKD domain-containing protein, partial [Solirubrobacter sp.]